jgi:hypothetical protein
MTAPVEMVSPLEKGTPERRRAHRRQVLWPATIVFRDGHCTMRATVMNISEHGALVMPELDNVVPDLFELRIRDGKTYRACVANKREPMIGVEFM